MVRPTLSLDGLGVIYLPLMTNMIWYGTKEMEIRYWMKQMNKFNILEMKMVFDFKKKDEKNGFFFKRGKLL